MSIFRCGQVLIYLAAILAGLLSGVSRPRRRRTGDRLLAAQPAVPDPAAAGLAIRDRIAVTDRAVRHGGVRLAGAECAVPAAGVRMIDIHPGYTNSFGKVLRFAFFHLKKCRRHGTRLVAENDKT